MHVSWNPHKTKDRENLHLGGYLVRGCVPYSEQFRRHASCVWSNETIIGPSSLVIRESSYLAKVLVAFFTSPVKRAF